MPETPVSGNIRTQLQIHNREINSLPFHDHDKTSRMTSPIRIQLKSRKQPWSVKRGIKMSVREWRIVGFVLVPTEVRSRTDTTPLHSAISSGRSSGNRGLVLRNCMPPLNPRNWITLSKLGKLDFWVYTHEGSY